MAQFCLNILLLFVAIIFNVNLAFQSIDTDWTEVLTKLDTQYALWQSYNIDTYVYSQQRWGCECVPCTTIKQFVTVIGGDITKIEYSQVNNFENCSIPKDLMYVENKTIDDWFKYSIEHANSSYYRCGNNDGEGEGEGLYCDDVSFEILYDDTYAFPIQIVIDRMAMAYDGGIGWDFTCFDGYYQYGNTLNTINTTSCNYTTDINIISFMNGSLPDECHNCLVLNDGCNDCQCSFDGYIFCTLMACFDTKTGELIEYQDKTCVKCIEDELYWLTDTCNNVNIYTCDSIFVDIDCVPGNISACKCPFGYSYHEALNGDKGCILTSNCPISLGEQLNEISDEILFSYPTQNNNQFCGYEYQICQWDRDCADGFECILADYPYDIDKCAKLFCYLDADCNKYDCLDDCLGAGFGVCTPEQNVVSPPSQSSIVKSYATIVLFLIYFLY